MLDIGAFSCMNAELPGVGCVYIFLNVVHDFIVL